MQAVQRKAADKQKQPGRIQLLPIDKLVPTDDNRRRPVTEAKLRPLAKSIASQGMVLPIVVRVHPTDPNRYEIRAGERRWRAARLAGLKVVPAIVRKLSDFDAFSVTLVENTQREDLHALEEAEAIELALKRGHDYKAIAARLGRSVQHVVRRASLAKLVAVWRKAILAADSEASRLSPVHLELIARLPETTQARLAEDDFRAVFGRGFPTIEELRRIIDADLHTLRVMPWALDDDTLLPEAGKLPELPKTIRQAASPVRAGGRTSERKSLQV